MCLSVARREVCKFGFPSNSMRLCLALVSIRTLSHFLCFNLDENLIFGTAFDLQLIYYVDKCEQMYTNIFIYN
jgi:hypothetical protein